MRSSGGHVLLAYLAVILLSTILVSSALNFAGSSLRANASLQTSFERLYRAEAGMNRALSWLRENSDNLLSLYAKENFYSNFSPNTPSYGKNDILEKVPTQLKAALAGAQGNAVILSNDSALASSYHPETINLSSGNRFDVVASFAAAGITESLVKITLIGANPIEPSSDYGPPPNKAPETDFVPVFRIDSMSDLSSGVHIHGYVEGTFERSEAVGFYGQHWARFDGYCDSYNSGQGAYSATNRKAGCSLGSNKNLIVHRNGEIYGSAKSNDKSKVRGEVCADFDPGCPKAGETCSGASCSVPDYEASSAWSTLCPSDRGVLDVSADTTLRLSGDLPQDRCWREVIIRSNATLTLASSGVAYYFEKLTFESASKSKLRIEPDISGETVELYLDALGKKSTLDGEMIKNDKRPGQFKLNYLAKKALSFDGKTDISAHIFAPNARVNLKGQYNFFGAISARLIDASKTSVLHFDESIVNEKAADMKFTLTHVVQNLR